MPVEGYRDEVNTHKTPGCVRTMDSDVANIDKNGKNKWRTIYYAIDAPYFGGVQIFPKSCHNYCKKHTKDPQNIPAYINKNIKICIKRNFILSVG